MHDEQAMRVFFEIHSGLPREGPGDSASTRKAFAMLGELPERPRVLDVGCGPGMQTLDLAELTDGQIVALDNHQPFLDQLTERAAQKGLAGRIRTVNADMAALDFAEGSFDIIWAEGSAYNMGFENALRAWRALLRSPGYLAVSEIAWTRPDPPAELEQFFADEYPAMLDVDANLEIIRRSGYTILDHFLLPESAWWDHYYTPVEAKLPGLRNEYRDDPKALEVIHLHQREVELYRRYADYYGYTFFVMRVG